jgi:hypothetical protein
MIAELAAVVGYLRVSPGGLLNGGVAHEPVSRLMLPLFQLTVIRQGNCVK